MKIKDYLGKLPSDTTMKTFYLLYARKSEEAEDRQIQSIDDQINILSDLAFQKNLQILKIFSENKSAKQPGRREFNSMVELIDSNPEIKGLLVWKLNRLFRNPEDEGRIRQRLSDGRIQEIVTPSKAYYEMDSDFTMAVEGAQAQRFIRDLRQDTIRGIMSKIDKGIAPIKAPVGYFNDKTKNQGERDILPHPIYFSLMRKVFELAMTGNYSAMQLHRQAIKMQIKNSKGNLISKSRLLECLYDPFYTGNFLFKSNLYPGIHQALVTEEEFDLIQEKLNKKPKPRKRTQNFISGLIRCGNCNHGMITGETHVKKSGKIFSYYRCTKSKGRHICDQPYIKFDDMEKMMSKILANIRISPKFVKWAIKQLNKENNKEDELRRIKLKAAQKALDEASNKLHNLTRLKISSLNNDNSLLSDEEFKDQKREILLEKASAERQIITVSQEQNKWTDLVAKTFDFATKAQDRFEKGDIPYKIYLMKVVSQSNFLLKEGILEANLRKPFELIKEALSQNNVKIEPKKDYVKSTRKPYLYLSKPAVGRLALSIRNYFLDNNKESIELQYLLNERFI